MSRENEWIDLQKAWGLFPGITLHQQQQFQKMFTKVKMVVCSNQEQLIILSLIYFSILLRKQSVINNLKTHVQNYAKFVKIKQIPNPRLPSVLAANERGLSEILQLISQNKQIDLEQQMQYFSDSASLQVLEDVFWFITKNDNEKIQCISKIFNIRVNLFITGNSDKITLVSKKNLKEDFVLDILCFSRRFFMVQVQNTAYEVALNINSPANYSSINSPAIRNPTISKTPLNQINGIQGKQYSSFSTEASRHQQNSQYNMNEEAVRKQNQMQNNKIIQLQQQNINNASYQPQEYMNQYGNNQQYLGKQQQQLNNEYPYRNNISPVKNLYQNNNNNISNNTRFQSSPAKQFFCSYCQKSYNNTQEIYQNQFCGHAICRPCLFKLKYPNSEYMNCFRKGCTNQVKIHDLQSFLEQDAMRESKSVKQFDTECSYCSKKASITLDRIPEYFKCQACNNVSCLLHSKPSKLESCFCICQRCLSETKGSGKMKYCEKCKISKCIRCKQTFTQNINLFQCSCGCLICGRSLQVYPGGIIEQCECSKQICSICLIPFEQNTLFNASTTCPHINCHPCFVQSQTFQGIKCTLCQNIQ